jgi:two-component system sensor histidine kinase KdpD
MTSIGWAQIAFVLAAIVAAGSGLGLAICRGLVGAMGGRIAAESPVTAGRRGTRMIVRFPSA